MPPATQSSGRDDASSSSSFLSRTVFNSLPGRFGRAALQNVKNAAFMPLYLSPWGDSSPVEVPNVRKRDIALFPIVTPWEVGDQVLGITAKKEDAYTSEVVELSGDESMLQSGHGHHFLAELPLAPPLYSTAPSSSSSPTSERQREKLVEQLIPDPNDVARSGSVCTLRVRIRHRYVDERAKLRFHGEKQDKSFLGTSKGWFAPYFHATNRTPYVPRYANPLMVVCDGPGLWREGDFSLAADLVNTSPWVLDFCQSSPAARSSPPPALSSRSPPSPTSPSTKFRLAIMLIAISPPAPLIGWSSSRRPNECLMDFSIPNACPCILLPANDDVPLVAYDAHSLADYLPSPPPAASLLPSVHSLTASRLDPPPPEPVPGPDSPFSIQNPSHLSARAHATYIHSFLRLLTSPEHISNERMDTHVLRAVQLLVGCARRTGSSEVFGKDRISRRAGIVCFKVRSEMVEEDVPGRVDEGTAAESPSVGEGARSGLTNGSGTTHGARISRTWSRESIKGRGLAMSSTTVNGAGPSGSAH